MSVTFDQRVHVLEDVLVSDLDGECVILNLRTETYFGLDAVGTRMWTVLTNAESIQSAYEALQQEFDVEPDRLREDLNAILDKLVEHGLVAVGRN
jgi:hypothetical protein